MKTYNNPIAYTKRAMSTDVDACDAVGVNNTTTLYNGTLVTLGGLGTGMAKDMGYVYEVTPTTANTAVDVWMVVSPEINRQVETNMLIDPRSFEINPGRPADLVRPMPGVDVVHVTKANFGSNQIPDVTTNKYVEAAANGQLKGVDVKTATGILFQCIGLEKIPVGQEFVDGYILKCVQNPAI